MVNLTCAWKEIKNDVVCSVLQVVLLRMFDGS